MFKTDQKDISAPQKDAKHDPPAPANRTADKSMDEPKDTQS
jgi:hypothetical protein